MLKKIPIPGSKSHTNRALILATLSQGTTIIKNIAICDDTNYMIANLRKLGVKIQQKNTTVKVTGVFKKGQLNFPKFSKLVTLYTGNAGTTTRFLTALSPLTENKIIIDGDARMRERPIEELVKVLNQLGAKIESKNGCPPLHIFPKNLEGGTIKLPGNISSQYLSALLLTAPFFRNNTTISITKELYSKPYIAMTLKVMKEFGLKVENKNFRKFIIESTTKRKIQTTNSKKSKDYIIESDASSASYFGAYAALHPEKKIFLKNIHKNSLQGDIKNLQYLKKMGCRISENQEGTIIQGPSKTKSSNKNLYSNLKSLGTIDMNETPDLVMTFAVLALFAKGKTKITNISNLRIKETDRITALENEIRKLTKSLGIEKNLVKAGKDWIEIYGQPELAKNYRSKSIHKSQSKSLLRQASEKTLPILIHTYNDHRMAMSFGILTDLIPNLKIKNPECVAKSYPDFWKDLKKILTLKSKKRNTANICQLSHD